MPNADLSSSEENRLSDDQRLLLQKRLQKALIVSESEDRLESSLPIEPEVSFFQEGIWIMQQFFPDDTTYNRPVGVRILGELDEQALQKSLNEIVRRHQVLRWTYHFEGESIAAKLHPARPLEINKIVLEESASEKSIPVALSRYRAILFQPFDLSRYPLVRAFLFQVSPQEHLFIVVFHHIAFDAWSEKVFLYELSALYRQFTFQAPRALPPLTFHYAHYAQWMKNKLASQATDRLAEFWKNTLTPLPPLPKLGDMHSPEAFTFGNAWIERRILPPARKDKLQRLSQELGMTPFMLLLAGCYLVLYRHTGERNLVVGVPFALRKPAESERLIGLFINTLPLRGDLSENPSLAQLFSQIRTLAQGVHAHQDMPLREIVRLVRPIRSATPLPLFDVIFNLKSLPRSLSQGGGIRFESFEIEPLHEHFSLVIEVLDNDKGYEFVFISNSSKISRRKTAQLASDFEQIVQIMLEDSSIRLQDALGF